MIHLCIWDLNELKNVKKLAAKQYPQALQFGMEQTSGHIRILY